jgi:hypothetical protein
LLADGDENDGWQSQDKLYGLQHGKAMDTNPYGSMRIQDWEGGINPENKRRDEETATQIEEGGDEGHHGGERGHGV